MAQTAKIAEVMFEKALETYESQMQLIDLCNFEEPTAADMQNSNNVLWRPVQQHAPIITGWDLTGQETDIIEEAYPAVLGTPANDFVKQRADQMRTQLYWERRGKQSGKRQASNLNSAIASAVATQGSLFYRFNTATSTSGYDFISEAQAIMNERQLYNSGRCFILNDRDNRIFGTDLAGRQTLQGRPEKTWATGQIGQNIAEFDVYVSSALPNLVGGASPGTTVTGNQSFAPLPGTVVQSNLTGIVTNNDYRIATIPVAATANYNVGDKVTMGDVNSVGLDDKNNTGQLMTFTIVEIVDATTMRVYPKPISTTDAALTALEQAYGNIDDEIANADVVARLNLDASNKTNLFWDKSAVEVIGGTIPANLFQDFEGMKVITQKMSNGLTLYMVFSGAIEDLSFRFRIFDWWGVCVANPSNAGVAVTY